MPHFYSSSGQPHMPSHNQPLPFVHPPPGFGQGQQQRQMSSSVSGMHGGGQAPLPQQQSFFNSNIPPPIGSRADQCPTTLPLLPQLW
uniref:Uncharacterized protein n=1 Tax=Ditylenchus dipsaci TaxID=166011 RepID=A0A915DVE5_9BILA